MYLDPGFGGMLIQVLVAIVAAGGILIFSIRRKLRTLFSRNKRNDTDRAETDTDAAGASTSSSESNDEDTIDMLSDE